MEKNKDNLGYSEELPEETTDSEIIIPEENVLAAEASAENEDVGEEDGVDIITAEFTVIETEEEENTAEDQSSDIVPVNTSLGNTDKKVKKEKKKKKGTAKKILKGIGIFFLIAFLAFSGFVGYKVWEYLQVYVYTTQYDIPSTFENETISLNIEQVEIIEEILGFEMDENYVYLGIKYTITNKTDAPVEWKNFPLLMVREFVRDEEDTGYVLVENTDQPFEMTGLRNYAIFLEIDLRPAKDNLEVGSSRTTADIFKILKTDYETKEYFLTSDIFNEIVNLPELPAPEVETDINTAQ